MKDYPLVTIITPSYNQSSFIEATIRSVLEQDYPNIEYIIIDGGSTDGSVEIIRRYEQRLAYWISEKDKGQSDAINKGFARATGQYIAWLNSDDIYLHNAVSKAVSVLQQHPEAGLVYANCSKINKVGSRLVWRRYRQYSLLDLLSMCTIAQPTVFMRREILESVGTVDLSYHYLMDHQLWVRIAYIAPLIFEDDYWAGAREHSNAKNIAKRMEFAPEAHRIVSTLTKDTETAQLIYHNHRQIEAGLLTFEAGYLLADGKSADALVCYLKAIRLYPGQLRKSWRLIILSIIKLLRFGWLEKQLYRLRANRYRGNEMSS